MMPDFLNFLKSSPEQDKAVKQGDVAWSESTLYGTSDFQKYNPDNLIGRKGFAIYRKMMLDEQVKAVVKFKRDAITSRDHLFQFPESSPLSDSEKKLRIAIYETMIREAKGSFLDALNFVMSAMYQGFSMTEIVLQLFEHDKLTYIGIEGLKPKPFDTFLFQVDRFGNALEVKQELDGDEQMIDLTKFIYFTHNPEFDEHYGQSELREAYRSWFSKDLIIKFWNMFLERSASGFAWAQPTEGRTLVNGSAEMIELQNMLSRMQSATSMIMPQGIDLNIETPATTDAFDKALTWHDLAIAKSLLVPNLLGVTQQGDTGSYAQSTTQLEAFLWTLDADATRLEEALNEQLFGPLGKLNFADGLSPLFKFKPVSEKKMMTLISTWADMVQKGAATATETDEAHIRKLLDFPDAGEPIAKEPVSVAPIGGSPDDLPRAPIGDEETISGEQIRITAASFNRAQKRVSFNVIDRGSENLLNENVVKIEDKNAEMVAEATTRIQEELLGTPAGGDFGTFDFKPRKKNAVRLSIERMIREHWNLGEKHAATEIGRSLDESFSVNMERLDVLAEQYFKDKSFYVAGKLTADMIAIIRNELANGLKYSWATEAVVRKIYDSLTREGVISMESNGIATGRAVADVSEALEGAGVSLPRLRTIVRTNGFEAINEARFDYFTDPALDDFVDALEYSAILDSRTTEICRHLDGRVYPADSPNWDGFRPPNHFNCRSLLVAVTEIDEDVTGKDKAGGNTRWSNPPRIEPQQGFGGSEQ